MAVPTVICMKVTNSQQNHVYIPCTGIYRNGNNLESVDRNLFIPPNKIVGFAGPIFMKIKLDTFLDMSCTEFYANR